MAKPLSLAARRAAWARLWRILLAPLADEVAELTEDRAADGA